MIDPEHVDLGLLARFAAELDPLMRDILVSEDVRQASDFVDNVTWHCLEQPYQEHLWGTGGIYGIWMNIDDILDGWPVDYGADRETLALREFKRVAQTWLDMPRTEAGLRNHVRRWETRMAEGTWPALDGIHWQQRPSSSGDRDAPH